MTAAWVPGAASGRGLRRTAPRWREASGFLRRPVRAVAPPAAQIGYANSDPFAIREQGDGERAMLHDSRVGSSGAADASGSRLDGAVGYGLPVGSPQNGSLLRPKSW